MGEQGEFANVDDCNSACDTTTTISENSKEIFGFYPNPNSSDGQLIFTIEDDLFKLDILNLQGQLVHSQWVENKTLNLQGLLKSGVYFIQVNAHRGKLIVR